MTDATRTALSRIISGESAREDTLIWRLSVGTVDRFLTALNLTLEAASALMDGTAVVVPREPTDGMHHRMLLITRDAGYGHVHDAAGGAVYRAALAASPYRSNSNAGV